MPRFGENGQKPNENNHFTTLGLKNDVCFTKIYTFLPKKIAIFAKKLKDWQILGDFLGQGGENFRIGVVFLFIFGHDS